MSDGVHYDRSDVRALYTRLAGRRDMNLRTFMRSTDYEEGERAKARADSYAVAIGDLLQLFGVAEEDFK